MRSATVAGAAVLILRAVASPVGGDDDIGESAFDGLRQEAFDDPRDGHKGLGEGDVGRAGYTISSAIAESHVGVAGRHEIELTVCIQSWCNKS